MDAEVIAESIDRHPLVSLVSACFWVILWLLSWIKSLIAFATITIPRFIYAILSYSITLTLDFWNFVALFALSAIALNYFIRFRYLNDYAQLKEPPLVKPDVNELHPDVNTAEPPPTFHNYLDDFLQAVRVFGFLEKPVFHELARHLQTRRLIAGDSMSLLQDKSFYCVIDGTVQVFAQTGSPSENDDLWDEEDMNGYQLLNEVGSGGTLSSLFTILSLFTEDVQISWQDDYSDDIPLTATAEHPGPHILRRVSSDISSLSLDEDSGGKGKGPGRRPSISSAASTVHATDPALHPASLLSPGFDGRSRTGTSTTSRPRSSRPSHAHRGVIARATEDSTLAVIPAEAFKRLTKKYPKATGHIVQVILTRFSRVTFSAAHKYLGLTSEVLRTEKAINDIAYHPLPNSFYEGGGLQYLRQRFDGATSEPSAPDSDYFSYSSASSVTAVSAPKDSSAASLGKVSDNPIPIKSHGGKVVSPPAKTPRHMVQAGDLLIPKGHAGEDSRPLSRTYSVLNTPRIPRFSESPENGKSAPKDRGGRSSSEEFDLRDEVMSCIAKSIGLLQPPLSGSDSAECSPRLPPLDARRSSATPSFSSPFSSLSLLDVGDDESSATGASSVLSSGDYMRGLDNEVEILYYPAGSTLAKAGEVNAGLFYVIEGFLDILLPEQKKANGSEQNASPNLMGAEGDTRDDQSKSKLLFTVKPGGIAGYLASLCNTTSYVDIKAKTDTFVGFLPSQALERLLEKRPIVLLTLAKRLISLLSPLVLHIDASLDWMQVNAGQVLWRPDDASDSFYIVINGRLRAIKESEREGVRIVGEYGQGDTVGELDVITSSPRSTTVHAIRDTELIRMPQTLFNAISARNPQTTAQILRMIASRVRKEVDSSSGVQGRSNPSEFGANNSNLKTVAVLPVSRSVPIDTFARKLQAALEGIGASTAYLNQAIISSQLGRHAFTRIGKLKASLANQEQRYRIVLYVADSPVNSSWTQTCIRQADCVMVVGLGDDPSVGEYERLLLSMKTTARKELVLLHPDRSVFPGSTREWLKTRPWVHRHIHIELPDVTPIQKTSLPKDPDAVTAFKNLKERVQIGIQKYTGTATTVRPQRLPHTNDFARLARRLCGKSIGLVLGGGGARGIAHLGLIRALEENGVPIDHIGGTSIGALIGGLYAREGDLISSTARAKHFAGRMGNIWRILSDVTYPIVAYTTAFYDTHIEDMWLPFFCNTTNIITSRMEIHETGYAWRYIRASMTLVGLLPPLCDNGQLLVDGGYIDNLPVQAMFSTGASTVFACDVGSIDDNSPRNFGDTISGWWLLINRWNPFSAARHVPAITEIQSRLAYVSSVNTLEDAKVAQGSFYIQMPIQEYGTLSFGKFEEIQKKGYSAALEALDRLVDEGKLPPGLLPVLQLTRSVPYRDDLKAYTAPSLASLMNTHGADTDASTPLDVNVLREIAKKSLVDALNAVNGVKTLVLDPTIAGPLGLITEVSLLKACSPVLMVDYHSPIKRHGREAQKHNYTLLLVPRLSTLVSRILEEEGVLGEVAISAYNLQFIPLADDVISLERDNVFKELWVDGDETVIFDSAQALISLQNLFGPFPRIVGKGNFANRLANLLAKPSSRPSGPSVTNSLLNPPPIDSLIVLDRRVDMITPLLTQLTYEGLIDELIGLRNSHVELPTSLLTPPNAQNNPNTASTSQASAAPITLKKESKKKHHLTTTTDPLYAELRDLNFSAVGRKLNRTNLQSKTVAQLRDFVGKLGGLQTEHQALRLHLLASYEINNQIASIEEMVAQGAELHVVLRLLCIASIIAGGIKSKVLENLKREILQTYGYEYLPLLLSLASWPLAILLPNPLPPNTPANITASKYPYIALRKSLRLLIDDNPEALEEVENDISYVYSGYAPISIRLVQCIAQKGGVLSNPAEKDKSGTENNSGASKANKVHAHPIVGWKGFEDVIDAIPGETIDIALDHSEGSASSGMPLTNIQQTSTTVVFFLGGCTYTEIAALRWMARQNTGRRFLIATTGIVSGSSIIEGIAGVGKTISSKTGGGTQ
ncbi:hypothetical protein NP233_g3232 [Leucocoprinus birnbaumii]|uniref:Lysophospholipase NTE1 n=1 Tax=Leucocoprinus birnbaumii TaxID=56174 RepID=A0AAD5YU47_9AGAR|nr:hypothetical protein NP233_g3232 [Leucocoprinus birnbaumii]